MLLKGFLVRKPLTVPRMDWVLLGSVVSRKAAEKVQPRNWYYVTYRSPNWGIRVAEIFTLALYRAGR